MHIKVYCHIRHIRVRKVQSFLTHVVGSRVGIWVGSGGIGGCCVGQRGSVAGVPSRVRQGSHAGGGVAEDLRLRAGKSHGYEGEEGELKMLNIKRRTSI